jgi:hypothetical protein
MDQERPECRDHLDHPRQGRAFDTAGQVYDGNAQTTIHPLALFDGQGGIATRQETQIPFRLILLYAGHI